MSQDKTSPAKDAGREYAEIWGEAIHSNRHLRTITVGLGIAVILLIIVVIRIASADPPRPIVVRVDEIGRAEAVAYDVMEAQADPLDPTTKYFLNRFVYDFYSRRRATVEENWSRSLRFLTTDLANASFRAESQNIALLAAGAARDELQVDRVVLRIQANPQEPHSASADFDLVRLVAEGEVDRERWSLSLQFLFLDEIPPDLIVHNPMGIVITYLQGDRAVVTGGPMIEHLKGRERALAALGWTGREAEWIALVCLHSGVFTRAQFCHYFEAHRSAARRIVRTLLERREAVESEWPVVNGGGKSCRISSKPIYRALGIENIRHRRKATVSVLRRRLLSLDFVLEHPGMNWLPTEGEKVEFIEGLGVHSNLIPRRIYYGAVRAQKRYFALKLPVAGGDKTVTFAYVDPGHATAVELHSWGAAHGPLWDAIRAKGRRVEVIAIGAELDAVLRADRVLQLWAAAEPGKVAAGLTVKQEISAISDAIDNRDMEFLAKYGGMGEAGKRYMALRKLPEAELAKGVSIDDYSTFRATRFSEPV